MSVRHRFVVGTWLLLVCSGLVLAGGELWSRVPSHHQAHAVFTELCVAVVAGSPPGTSQTACPPEDGADTGVSLDAVAPIDTTNSNHIPGGLLLVAGCATGVAGLLLVRSAIRRGWWAAQAPRRQLRIRTGAAVAALALAVIVATGYHAAAIRTGLAVVVALAFGEWMLARARRSRQA